MTDFVRPVDLLLPARNEEEGLPRVLAELPRELVRRVVVVDNGSTDGTARVAQEAGAIVVREPRPGYGRACLAGLDWLRRHDPPEIVAFLDADHSDRPEELPAIVGPILAGRADLVIGSRVLGEREPGALLPQARFGNWLACRLMRLRFGRTFTDLGPFRAIRWQALERIRMRDRTFGWTVEMQLKALRLGLPVLEVPVSYRRRIGRSKITGTLSGSLRAGGRILWTILRYSLAP